MAINMNGSVGKSKIGAGGVAGVIKGFETGGPAGGLASLAGSVIPAAGQLIDRTGLGSKMSSSQGDPASKAEDPTEIGVDDSGHTTVPDEYNPIAMKLQNMSQDPQALTAQALEILKDPTIPQDLRDQYAEPLLRYKHYGSTV